MSFFSNFSNWLGRLFGRRPNPTQALREEIARHHPAAGGAKQPEAAPVKAEPTPYPTRGGAQAPTSAPPAPVVAKEPPKAAEAPSPSAEQPAAPEGPVAPPSLKGGRTQPLPPREEPEAEALAIPEPEAAPEIAEKAPPAEPAAPAPPPILPPISLLAPPAKSEPRPTADDPPHSPVFNAPLSDQAQPEGMKLDIAPLASPAHPAAFVFDDEDPEGLVDLSLVDEDMEALDARSLGRARPMLAPPPLDMLVARWRVALSRMQGPDGSWALFKHGTVALFETKPRNAEAEAKALLRALAAPRSGAAPEPVVTALPNNGGWLVGGEDPRLFTYVAPEEASVSTPPTLIGRLGRAKRDEDARDLEISHIENDPFWRPPED